MIKIDKHRNPIWPPAAILDFGLEPIKFERLELDTSNLAQCERFMNGTWRNYQIDNCQNPRWPPAAILNFGLEAITHYRLELYTLNLAQG